MAKNLYELRIVPHLNEIPELLVHRSEAEIAKYLGVPLSTFKRYKAEHKELQDALMQGRACLVREAKETLRRKALGFHYEETKTTIKYEDGQEVGKLVETHRKYAQPDTASLNLILKNYDPEWHNDDVTTIKLKEKQIEIAQQKADQSDWS